TFFATASSVSMCGATPVFADVDPRTFNIDPESASECISKKTKAIVGVHLFGQPFDVPALQEICTDHRLVLIEDAAQAHGATYKGRKVGGFGFAGCFSFYATKNMLTGEGGMITTDDRTAAERMRLFINHGQSQKYLHTVLGYNFRLTDMGSAIGLVQLRRLDEMNARRVHNAAYFDRHIRMPDCALPYRMPDATHVYHQYVLTLGDAFPLSRADLGAALKEKGIGTAVHYPIPLSRQPLYEASGAKDRCPVASRLSERVLSLPVHPQVSDAELSYMCTVLSEVI
ncbi:MAG: DegT/DnrJ/EryC1/StrS family aminotransferase, partial [Methanobacteriota archaeon]